MNKSLFILLSTLTMLSHGAGFVTKPPKDEIQHNVDKLPLALLASHHLNQTNQKLHMAGKGLKGGGPVAGAWGYSVTKAGCYTAVGAAATYAVVQSGGMLAGPAKVVIGQAAGVVLGNAAAGEVVVGVAAAGAKAGIGAKVMAGIGTGAAALGSYLPWAIEGVSGAVGAALTACPLLP